MYAYDMEMIHKVRPWLQEMPQPLTMYHDESNDEYWICLTDVALNCDRKIQKQYLSTQINKLIHTPPRMAIPNLTWINHQGWEPISIPMTTQRVESHHKTTDQIIKPEKCIAWTDIRRVVTWLIQRSRQSTTKKQNIWSRWFHSEPCPVSGTIEQDCLDLLSQVCPWPIQYQYRVGPYRMDAYIEPIHLVIQIDENGHRHYPPEEEQQLDQLLHKMNFSVLRINPDLYEHPSHVLVTKVMQFIHDSSSDS